VPLQGPPPDGFTAVEASLRPDDCGSCHVAQFEEWRTTVHAGAFSPGLEGQLVEMREYGEVRSCLACHAPLGEQSARVPDGSGDLVTNPFYDPELQRRGLTCGACHVRGWRRYGPPRRDGSAPASPGGAPHGGAVRTPFFEDARFCAGCHQFSQPAPNGKPLQNTHVEWEASRYVAAGIGCQTCHMPDRRHVWRGIHDSATVQGGVTIAWFRPDGADGVVGLRITNTGVGHRFPTYVTPKVRVRIELLDAAGQRIAGAAAEDVIGRDVRSTRAGWVEDRDTRLAPDSSFTVVTATPDAARRARGRVTVFPDGFYNELFTALLTRADRNDTSRALLTEALRRTDESAFVLFDETIPLP